MFGLFRDPVGDGVKASLESSFRKGGRAYKALGDALEDALKPFAEELKRLRLIEARYKWHPLADAKPWVFDGRTLLLWRDGDIMFGHWEEADDLSPGYWDRCEEYGGEPIEPPPTHFYILRKSPTPATPDPAP